MPRSSPWEGNEFISPMMKQVRIHGHLNLEELPSSVLEELNILAPHGNTKITSLGR
jgi:hypothetical protein